MLEDFVPKVSFFELSDLFDFSWENQKVSADEMKKEEISLLINLNPEKVEQSKIKPPTGLNSMVVKMMLEHSFLIWEIIQNSEGT